MKKLKWNRKVYHSPIEKDVFYMAKIKELGWEFTIYEFKDGTCELAIYYGIGDDIVIPNEGHRFLNKDVAKIYCQSWLKGISKTIKKYE
jgi:hypothetical protein